MRSPYPLICCSLASGSFVCACKWPFGVLFLMSVPLLPCKLTENIQHCYGSKWTFFPGRSAWPLQLYLVLRLILAEMTYNFLSSVVELPQSSAFTCLLCQAEFTFANLSLPIMRHFPTSVFFKNSNRTYFIQFTKGRFWPHFVYSRGRWVSCRTSLLHPLAAVLVCLKEESHEKKASPHQSRPV